MNYVTLMLTAATVLLAMLPSAGCGESYPASGPTSPSPGVSVPTPTNANSTLSGFVVSLDGRWVPVVGAAVHIVDGPMAGVEVRTDTTGVYRIVGLPAGAVTVQVVHADFRSAVASANLPTDRELNFLLLREEHPVEHVFLSDILSGNVSADDPDCDTADPRVEELKAPCKSFQFTAPRTGTLAADLTWSDSAIFMELLTPSLGKCCTSPLRLQFAVTAGLTYTLSVGFHGTTGGAPRGTAPFELRMSLVP